MPYDAEPLVSDLMQAITQQLGVVIDTQRLIFRGQKLHETPSEPLKNYGVCNSNKIRCIGRRSFNNSTKNTV